jgi:hypothetical protein
MVSLLPAMRLSTHLTRPDLGEVSSCGVHREGSASLEGHRRPTLLSGVKHQPRRHESTCHWQHHRLDRVEVSEREALSELISPCGLSAITVTYSR